MANGPEHRPLSWEYAFTITLKPSQYVKTPQHQISDNVDDIRRTLALLGEYTLVWEFTKAMNIHFHGIIKMYLQTPHGRSIHNLRLRWYNAWRQQLPIGMTDFTTVTDLPGWKAYITKDVEANEQNRGLPHPVLQDDIA